MEHFSDNSPESGVGLTSCQLGAGVLDVNCCQFRVAFGFTCLLSRVGGLGYDWLSHGRGHMKLTGCLFGCRGLAM